MVKLKRKLIILIILAISFTSFGVFMTYKLLIAPKKAPKQWTVPNASNSSTKFSIGDTLVKEMRKKKEVITFEVDLEEDVAIDSSWGELDMFKKIQNVKFYGRGIYVVDLSDLDSTNLTINKKSNSINLLIPKPTVKTISIEESKTIYTSPQLGIFRFGEVTLTASEYNSLLAQVKNRMSVHLMNSNLYETALKESEDSIRNIFTTIISENNIKENGLEIKFK